MFKRKADSQLFSGYKTAGYGQYKHLGRWHWAFGCLPLAYRGIYHKQGKIHWAKLCEFHPMKFSRENIHSALCLKHLNNVIIWNLYNINIHGKLLWYCWRLWKAWKFSPANLAPFMVVVTSYWPEMYFCRKIVCQPPLLKMRGENFVPMTTNELCSQWKKFWHQPAKFWTIHYLYTIVVSTSYMENKARGTKLRWLI